MRRIWWFRGLRFVVFAIAATALVGAVVMLLWNALMPVLFGWPLLGYGQALGLFVLSRILFGGFRGGRGGRSHWRARMAERWSQMSEEEREQFRSGMRRRCGGRDTSATPSSA